MNQAIQQAIIDLKKSANQNIVAGSIGKKFNHEAYLVLVGLLTQYVEDLHGENKPTDLKTPRGAQSAAGFINEQINTYKISILKRHQQLISEDES